MSWHTLVFLFLQEEQCIFIKVYCQTNDEEIFFLSRPFFLSLPLFSLSVTSFSLPPSPRCHEEAEGRRYHLEESCMGTQTTTSPLRPSENNFMI